MEGAGSGPCVIFECRPCSFRTKNYHRTWREHILAESHQEKARQRVKFFDVKAKKRSVVVFGISSVKSKIVLKHFGDLAVVTDFTYWKERPDFCIFTFINNKFRNSMIISNHIVQDRKLFLRALDEIPEAEWISICPYAGHPQEMDVDSGDSNDDNLFEGSSEDELLSDGETNENETMSTHSSNYNESGGTMNGHGNSMNDINVTNTSSPTTQMVSAASEIEKTENVALPRTLAKTNTSNSGEEQFDTISSFDEEYTAGGIEEPDFDATANFEMPFVDKDANQSDDTVYAGAYSVEDKGKLLNSMMETFYDRNLMPMDEWSIRNRTTERIEFILRTIYPKCVLVPFGVGSTAISFGGEVLSIYVDIFGHTVDDSGQGHTMDVDTNNCQEISKNIIKALCQAQFKTEIRQLQKFEDKITFTYLSTGSRAKVQCMLQSTNFLAVQCCRIINFLCTLDDRVRPLLLIVRHWAYHHHLVKSNPGENKYIDVFHPSVFQWIVMYFLMKKDIILSIETLQKYAKTPLLHGGDNIAFCNNVEQLNWDKKSDFILNPETGNPSATCVLQLAQEMFEYFGTTKVPRSVISVNLGTNISRALLSKARRGQENNFTGPFQSSVAWNQTKGLKQRPIIIQHPLKLHINMTSDVSGQTEKLFRYQCRYTAELLKALLLEDSPLDNPIMVLVYPVQNSSNNGVNEVDPLQRLQPMVNNDIPNPPQNLQRIQDFNIQLGLTGKLKHLVKTSQSQFNVPALWSEAFAQFNSVVWPACFGVELFSLPDATPRTVSSPWRLLVAPFKGVVTNPKRLDWMGKKFNKKMFKFELKKLSEELKVAMRQPIKVVLPQSARDISLNNTKIFSFDCEVSGLVSRSNGTILLHFTNTWYKKKSSTVFKKTISKAYIDLWKTFSDKKLLYLSTT